MIELQAVLTRIAENDLDEQESGSHAAWQLWFDALIAEGALRSHCEVLYTEGFNHRPSATPATSGAGPVSVGLNQLRPRGLTVRSVTRVRNLACRVRGDRNDHLSLTLRVTPSLSSGRSIGDDSVPTG